MASALQPRFFACTSPTPERELLAATEPVEFSTASGHGASFRLPSTNSGRDPHRSLCPISDERARYRLLPERYEAGTRYSDRPASAFAASTTPSHQSDPWSHRSALRRFRATRRSLYEARPSQVSGGFHPLGAARDREMSTVRRAGAACTMVLAVPAVAIEVVLVEMAPVPRLATVLGE